MADIQMMSGEISWAMSEYVRPEIEEKFEEYLYNLNKVEYCKYISMKIVCFVEIYYQSKIISMTTEWVEDDYNRIYLINATNVKHQTSQKASYNELFLKRA